MSIRKLLQACHNARTRHLSCREVHLRRRSLLLQDSARVILVLRTPTVQTGIKMSSEHVDERAWHYKQMTKARPVSGDTKKVIESYDDLANSYDEHASHVGYTAHSGAARGMLRVVADKQARILEVGSGTGLLGEVLFKEGYTNVYALDPSEKSCEVARKKGCYTKVIQGIAHPESPIAYDDGYFHAIVSSGAFQPGHCDQKDIPELVRLLQPGGYLVTSTRKVSLNETDTYRVKSALKHYTDTNVLEEVSYEEFDDYFGYATEDVTGIILIHRKK